MFLLAIEAELPVVPVSIARSRFVMLKGRLMTCPGDVTLTVHAPIPTDGVTREQAREFAERVRAIVRRGWTSPVNCRTPRYNDRLIASFQGQSMHVTAIIAAGGTGRRLGADVPKQLLAVGGVPILAAQRRSVSVTSRGLRRHRGAAIVDGCGAAGMAEGRPGRRRRRQPAGVGGECVRRSAWRASDVVLVHDAARPFVSGDVISRAIDAAAAHGAAIVAVPVSDTVKRIARRGRHCRDDSARHDVSGADAAGVPPRAFWQRPSRWAARASRRTDEAALAERAGHAVRVVVRRSREREDHDRGRSRCRPRAHRARARQP